MTKFVSIMVFLSLAAVICLTIIRFINNIQDNFVECIVEEVFYHKGLAGYGGEAPHWNYRCEDGKNGKSFDYWIKKGDVILIKKGSFNVWHVEKIKETL